MVVSAKTYVQTAQNFRHGYFAPSRARRVAGRAEPNDNNSGSTIDPVEAQEDAARWKQIDDQIRNEMMADEVQETLPLPFLATVSSFGTALTGYLTWSKLTNNQVVCPLSGCTSILSSPYAQIGPVPLSALGLLGYTTVASLCFCSMALKSQPADDVLRASMWLTRAQQGILYGSSILAGTSIALAVTLKTQFPDETCAFCMASIAASLTLYFTSFFTSRDESKSLSFGSVAATTLLVTGLYATYPDNVTASASLRHLQGSPLQLRQESSCPCSAAALSCMRPSACERGFAWALGSSSAPCRCPAKFTSQILQGAKSPSQSHK
eukprot:jgi/Ulvmu1/4825/UM020_0110.1